MDHLVTALWHIMGNLKFIVNQNRGRGEGELHIDWQLKLGQAAEKCGLRTEHFKTLVNYAVECKSTQEFLLKLLFIYPRSSLIKYESKLV